MVERGLDAATALAPVIGYDAAAAIAKEAAKTGETVREVALRRTDLNAERLRGDSRPAADGRAERRPRRRRRRLKGGSARAGVVALDAAILIDAASVLIIVVGTAAALIAWVRLGFAGPVASDALSTQVRIPLARQLTLALEFLIGSDIIRTAVTPSWTELGQLTAIVILRVVIIFSLEHDTRTALRTQAVEEQAAAG